MSAELEISTFTCQLPNHSYPVSVGQGLLKHSELLSKWISGRPVLLVTHPILRTHYSSLLEASIISLAAEFECVEVPSGDPYKTLETAQQIYTVLIEKGYGRDAVLVTFGGGMISDLGGFVASTFLRGIDAVHLPTSLLAQVDACLGGKTAVNHPLGKNLVGTFFQPKAVVCDIELFKTLPQREWIAGLGEVIKYALIAGDDFFEWLERNADDILKQTPHVVAHMVAYCVQAKLSIVAQDEKENGIRAHLNLGHTLGHALEGALGFETLLHGEAVALGLLVALKLSYHIQLCAHDYSVPLMRLCQKLGLPTAIPAHIEVSTLHQFMQKDKKNRFKQKNWILMEQPGQLKVVSNVPKDAIDHVLVHFGALQTKKS